MDGLHLYTEQSRTIDQLTAITTAPHHTEFRGVELRVGRIKFKINNKYYNANVSLLLSIKRYAN
jgi:hypothetical protein